MCLIRSIPLVRIASQIVPKFEDVNEAEPWHHEPEDAQGEQNQKPKRIYVRDQAKDGPQSKADQSKNLKDWRIFEEVVIPKLSIAYFWGFFWLCLRA